MEFDIFELSNGLRVVHRHVNRPVAHCGIHLAVGSRDEGIHEQGMAHFIEHTLFKGTKKRRAYHILSRMEDVGGELNAFTTKEETVLYTSFLSADYNRAIELLADIYFNSTFPEKEVVKEKEVVIDEINSYLDNPSESIFDDFEELIFKGHPLGGNILGTLDSVRGFKRHDIINFIGNNYGYNRMVFSSVGNISSARLKVLLEKHWSQIQNEKPRQLVTPNGYTGSEMRVKRPGYQAHAILGTRAYAGDDEKSRVLLLLNNLLGGTGMNSRLNLNIREKYGFTYHLESFYHPYLDTGIFGVYLGTDLKTVDKSLKLVQKELKKLRDNKLGILQLSKAKKQLLGQIAMAQENNGSLMLAYGKSMLVFDRIDTFERVQQKIEEISAERLMEVANEIFDPSQLSTLVYEPTLNE